MADKRPRIGVVGSSNVDLVTNVDRVPVWGETIAPPAPGTRSSAALPATSPPASPSMRRWKRRPAAPPPR